MEITQTELKEKLNNGEKVIVDFWAPWCGPCRMVKPIFEKVANENKEDFQMYTLNVDENRELALELGIRAVPTIKVFSSGNVVDTKMGVLQETQLKELVKNLINGLVINYGTEKDMKFKRIINITLLQLITVLKLIF